MFGRWFHSPFSIFPRSPKAAMPVRRCAIRSTSRGMSRLWAFAASGWPSITTCPASPARRRRWRSPMSRPERTTSVSVPAASCCRTTRRWSIAEQFGTLAALHPGRVELGLGRAPGSDQITAHAMRRNLNGGAEEFPQDVVELMAYFQPVQPGQRVQAVPGAGSERAVLDPRFQHLRRATRGDSGIAVRLRLAFRAGQ